MKERLINNFVMKNSFDTHLLMEEYSINEIISYINSKRMYVRFEEFFYRMGEIKKEEAYGRAPSKINMLPKIAYSECEEVDSDNDYITYYMRMGGAWVRPFLQMYCGLCPKEDGWGDLLAQFGPHRNEISWSEEHPDHYYIIEVSHEEWDTENYGLFPQTFESANHNMPTLAIGYGGVGIVDLTERRIERRLKKKGVRIEEED